MMRIAIIADACDPPTNGVIRTLRMLTACLRAMDHEVELVTPPGFATLPCPTQPDIRLAVAPGRRLAALIDRFGPDAVHIATEGPLGMAARRLCLRRRWPFTTMFTSKFAETVQARLGVPPSWIWSALRWFHAPSACVMVSTPSLQAELEDRGFGRVHICSRGVDTTLFRPRPEADLPYPRPIWLNVGRVAREKSIEDFLCLDLPGTKLVVGDGPDRKRLERAFPDAVFVGTKRGEELALHYAASDVFVFPSRTDTFGLVILEALASGLPVAAYPVTGPRDIIGGTAAGALDDDLGLAAHAARGLDPQDCALAKTYAWEDCAARFLENLQVLPNAPRLRGMPPEARGAGQGRAGP
jgi:glycosyltransferase involved in cell wall biosynthesis